MQSPSRPGSPQNLTAVLNSRTECIRPGNRRKSKGARTLYNINNNSSIHHTRTCMPAPARTRERPVEVLRNCGISNEAQPTCWECRFYVPNAVVDLNAEWRDECEPGECHRRPPVVGEPLKRGETMKWSEFPIVMACDWCGEFVPRTRSCSCDVPACGVHTQPRDTEAGSADGATRAE